MKQLMIIGTDTDVGKTYVSGLILKKLHENGKKAAYFKAAMSGNVHLTDGSLLPGDADFVKTISGISQPLADMCPYVYETAVSPHLAAKIEGNPIEWEKIQETYDTLCGTCRTGHTEPCGLDSSLSEKPEHPLAGHHSEPLPGRKSLT